jgi:phosphotransferase system enzyme I (PtsI)
MLHWVIAAARDGGIEVSLCGEMAADARYAPLLVGLGLRRLSLTPRSIPTLKTRLRELRVSDLEELAERCLAAPTAGEVEEILGTTLHSLLAAMPERR